MGFALELIFKLNFKIFKTYLKTIKTTIIFVSFDFKTLANKLFLILTRKLYFDDWRTNFIYLKCKYLKKGKKILRVFAHWLELPLAVRLNEYLVS